MELMQIDPVSPQGDRCHVGDAVATSSGKLPSRVCIHAVGPQYPTAETLGYQEVLSKKHKQLRSAYCRSLVLASRHGARTVACSLLSASIYRGGVPLVDVLREGAEGVLEGVHEARDLQEVRDVTASSFTADTLSSLV